jgi:hypothetical protein
LRQWIFIDVKLKDLACVDSSKDYLSQEVTMGVRFFIYRKINPFSLTMEVEVGMDKISQAIPGVGLGISSPFNS